MSTDATRPIDNNDLDLIADVITDAEVSLREDSRTQRFGAGKSALRDTADMLRDLRARVYFTKEVAGIEQTGLLQAAKNMLEQLRAEFGPHFEATALEAAVAKAEGSAA